MLLQKNLSRKISPKIANFWSQITTYKTLCTVPGFNHGEPKGSLNGFDLRFDSSFSHSSFSHFRVFYFCGPNSTLHLFQIFVHFRNSWHSGVMSKQSWDEDHFVTVVQQKVSECAHCVSTFGNVLWPVPLPMQCGRCQNVQLRNKTDCL